MLISLIEYNLPKPHLIPHEIPPSVYKLGVQMWNFEFLVSHPGF